MAKRSKQALAELDEAIDQLGGGAPPIPPQRKGAGQKRRPAARSVKRPAAKKPTKK